MKRKFDVFSSAPSAQVPSKDEKKYNIGKFVFGDKMERYEVDVREIVDKDYGCFLWDCSVVLSCFLFRNRRKFETCDTLEVSAGVGLPSLLLSKMKTKGRIILTDRNDKTILDNLAFSVEFNKIPTERVQIQGLNWGSVPSKMPCVDVILGSDCFYDEKYYDDLLMTISYVLGRRKGSRFFTTYVIRSEEDSIEILLRKWNLKGREIEIEDFLDWNSFSSVFEKSTQNETNIRSRFDKVRSSIRLYEIARILY